MSLKKPRKYDLLAKKFGDEITRKYPLKVLTREEETALIIRAKAGDTKAQNRLIMSHIRFIIKKAYKFNGRRQEGILEYVQEGVCGLIEAIKRFDTNTGLSLCCYGAYWINSYMIAHKASNTVSHISLPTNSLTYRVITALKKSPLNDREDRITSIAKQFNVSEGLVTRAEELRGFKVFGGDSLDEEVANEREEPVDELLDRALLTEKVRKLLKKFSRGLNRVERLILEERFLKHDVANCHKDIDSDKATLQEVGDKVNLTRESIRKKEAVLKSKLRDFLIANGVTQDAY